MQPWVMWMINHNMRIVVQIICLVMFPAYIVYPVFDKFGKMMGEWVSDWKEILRYRKAP